MKKTLLPLLLCLFLLLSACGKKPTAESADTPAPSEQSSEAKKDFITAEPDTYEWPAAAKEKEFQFNEETGTIEKYFGNDKVVVIPDKINSVPVLAIESAFDQNNTVTHVKVPEGVIRIDRAFYFCTRLTHVSLPESLAYIGAFTFFSNESLEKLVIPKTVVFIGSHAFDFCNSLSKITFLGETPCIDGKVMEGLDKNEIQILVADEEQEKISEALGRACIAKGAVNLVDRVPTDSDFDFDAASGTIKAYKGNMTAVSLPSEIGGKAVTAIGEGAFATEFGKSRLFRIDIPGSVKSIGEKSFKGNTLLSVVNFSEGLESIEKEAFIYTGICKFSLPKTVKNLGESAFSGIPAEDIEIPEGVAVLPENLFNSSKVVNLTIPASVTEIKDGALANCSSLDYLVFGGKALPQMTLATFYVKPEYAKTSPLPISDIDIAWDASREEAKAATQTFLDFEFKADSFYVWRSNRPDVASFPTADDKLSFDSTSKLVTAFEGKSTEMTMYYNFTDSNGQKQNIVGLSDNVFAGSNISKFYVPHSDKFTTIGNGAFSGSKLSYIDLFDSVENIGAAAFKDCTELKDIVIPASVAQIGSDAFAGCTKLESVKFLGAEVNIGAGAFSSCPALKQLVLPERTTVEGALTDNPAIIKVADAATDEEVAYLRQTMALPWYLTKLRVSDEASFVTMSEKASPEADFEFNAEKGMVMKYTGDDETVVIPKELGGIKVVSLGDYLFASHDRNAKKVIIPETVTAIGNFAFSQTMIIESIICYGPIEEVGNAAFENCKNLSEIKFVNGIKALGDRCFSFCENLKSFDLGEHLEEIPQGAFQRCGFSGALSVDVPIIGGRAFAQNAAVTELHLGSRIEKVDVGAFQGMSALTKVYVTDANPAIFENFTSKFDKNPKLKIILPAEAADAEVQAISIMLTALGLPADEMVSRG